MKAHLVALYLQDDAHAGRFAGTVVLHLDREDADDNFESMMESFRAEQAVNQTLQTVKPIYGRIERENLSIRYMLTPVHEREIRGGWFRRWVDMDIDNWINSLPVHMATDLGLI